MPTAADRDDGTRRPRPVERLAASVALVALPAALIILVVGAFRNWAALLAAVVALLVAVIAGWHVVTRKGLRRAAAGLVAALAFVVLLAAGILADLDLSRVAVILVLIALSAATARIALRRRARTATVTRPAPRPARPVLLMNPRSGGGKAERFGLADECRRRGIEAVPLRPGDDLEPRRGHYSAEYLRRIERVRDWARAHGIQ
ncbi:hypothetical protein AB0M96_31105, partial [Streptomyces sp. NPDC051098]